MEAELKKKTLKTSDQRSSDLTEGPLLPKIISFTIPLMLTGLLQTLYNATDMIVVGMFSGSVAMGAVGACSSLIGLIVNTFIGLAVGAAVNVARDYGAKKYGEVKKVASSADKTFSYIPELDKSEFTPDADYFHITFNNTIYGTRYTSLPDTGNVPLVADISSNILSEPIDVTKFGLLYAGAQKNMGPAGLTVVIIREDLIGDVEPFVPTMLTYKIHAENGSMYNTPPTYAIYICMLVLEWLKENGGIEAMYETNLKKAETIYSYLDSSQMFKGTVEPKDRSLMNVPFITDSEELNAKFIKEAKAKGFVNLKGHRTVGGMRASIYNAMSLEGVEALVDFMKEFEKNNK